MHSEHPGQGFGERSARPARYDQGVETRSRWIQARDGCRLAIDIIRPIGVSDTLRLPTLLVLTRYWRSMALRLPDPPGKAPRSERGPLGDFFATRGYNVVVADARGTGASEGSWRLPYAPQELQDWADVAAWIAGQPWSDGDVVSLGVSYEGSCAELLAATRCEAVRAVVPMEMDFDLYADLLFPGGVRFELLARAWHDLVERLDQDRLPLSVPWYLRLLVKGVRRVEEDPRGAQLAQWIQARPPIEVHQALRQIQFRDDPWLDSEHTLDTLSPSHHRAAVEATGAAICGWASWLDARTADGALARFCSLEVPQQLVIGAWNHTGEQHASPFAAPGCPAQPPHDRQWEHCLSFFDAARAPEGLPASERVIHYFTLGAEVWRTSDRWPPEGVHPVSWHLDVDGTLSPEPPTVSGADPYRVDFDVGTGATSRWSTQLGGPVHYPDRRQIDQRLRCYTSAPLPAPLEITGTPVIRLFLSSSASDGAVFVYLEGVAPDGHVHYLSEGVLRALHRAPCEAPPPYTLFAPHHSFARRDALPLVPGELVELHFGLAATSVRLPAGWRLRVAIAGADTDAFARVPEHGEVELTLHRGPHQLSAITLPIARPPDEAFDAAGRQVAG